MFAALGARPIESELSNMPECVGLIGGNLTLRLGVAGGLPAPGCDQYSGLPFPDLSGPASTPDMPLKSGLERSASLWPPLLRLWVQAATGNALGGAGAPADGDGGTKSSGLSRVFCLMIWATVTAGGWLVDIGDQGGLSPRSLGRATEACRMISAIVNAGGRDLSDEGWLPVGATTEPNRLSGGQEDRGLLASMPERPLSGLRLLIRAQAADIEDLSGVSSSLKDTGTSRFSLEGGTGET